MPFYRWLNAIPFGPLDRHLLVAGPVASKAAELGSTQEGGKGYDM